MASSSKPRSYTFYTKPTWRRKLVAWSMLFFYLTQPILASAEVVADPKAPVTNTPQVQTTANGLPIVQIAAPTAGGVSHNLYQKFNVDPRGLILNNSRVITQTQLAGYITGNPNLANGPARIILNEVTSNNPSYLRGYTEVAGQKAEVIIANPNGIYGDGFGFINTSRAVLTTGTPVFGGSGSLDAFRVTGGQISIQGNGMNASNTDQVDLISRAVNVNAGLYANQLNVVAGANQVNYNTLQAQPIAGDANTPQVQIDMGQLGGMYAQKIYMVGTEKGVGVNSRGIISSTGDLAINSEGKVTLAQTSARGNIAVTAKDQVTNQGSLYAQGSTTINSQGDFQNTGILASGQQTSLTAQNISSTGSLGAGITSDGKVGSNGDLILNGNGAIITQGQNVAGGNLSIKGTTLDLSGSQTTAGGNINLTATLGNINNTSGSIQTGNVLTASAQGTIHNDQDAAGVQAQIRAGQLKITAANITNQNSQIAQTGLGNTSIIVDNTLDNTVGQIETNGTNTTIQAANIINSQGQIQHAGTGNFALQTISDLTNSSGNISTNGQINFTAQNLDNSQGSITAQKQISVTTRVDVKNQHGTIMSADALNINAQGNVMNQQGDMEANKGLSITAQSFNNQSGRLVNLDGSNMKVNISHDIQNQSGLLGGNGNVNIATQTLENQGGKITSQGNLTVNATNGIDSNLTEGQVLNNGAIASGGDLTLNSEGKVLLSGNTSANGNIKVKAQGGFSNYGIVSGQNNTEINTQGALDNTGAILAGQDTIFTSKTVNSTGTVAAGVQDDGTLGNNGDLTVNTEGTVSLNGKNMAAGNLTVNGATLDLKNSKNIAGGAIKLTAAAGDIDHSGAMLHADGALTAQAQGGLFNDNGDITAAQLTLTGGSISNQSGTMTQVGQGNTNITAANNIDNINGTIATNGSTMKIQTTSLTNSRGKILHAGIGTLAVQASGDVKNDNGKLATNGQLTVAAHRMDNNKGMITAQRQLNLTTQADLVNSQGKVTGSDTVNITAQGVVYNQQGDMEASKGLEMAAQSLNNQNGRLVSLDASGLNVTIAQDVKNQSGLIGGNGKIDITAQNISNQEGTITSQGNLTVNATNGIDSNLIYEQVLNNGVIASGGDLTLNSAGKVLLSGNTSANGTIKVNAQGGFSNYGTVSGQDNTEITTQGALDNNGAILAGKNTTLTAQIVSSIGTMAAGVLDDGTLGNSGDLTVNASGAVALNGKNMAAGSLNVNGAALDLKNSKNISSGDIKITATTGDIDHSGAMLHTDGTVTAQAQGSILNDNGDITAAQLTLTGDSISNRSGTMTQVEQGNTTITSAKNIDNTSGTIATNGNAMKIQSASLTNSQGQLLHAGTGTLFIQASGDVKNVSGKLATNGQLAIAANTIDNTKGTVTGQQQVKLTTQADILNSQGILTGSNTVNINAKGAVNNQQGNIEASKGLSVTAQSINNQIGRLVNLDASDIKVNVAHDIQNQSGLLGGNGNIDITTQTLENQSGKITAQGNLTVDATNGIDSNLTDGQVLNNGSIASGGDLTLNSAGKVRLSGKTSANGNIKVNAQGGFSNYGTVSGQNNTEITTQGELGNTGTILAGKNTTLTAQTVNSIGTMAAGVLDDGSLGNNGDLTINAGEAVSLNGKNMAASNLSVNGASIDLTNSRTVAGGNAMLTADSGDISNTGATLQVNDTLVVNAANGTVHNDKDNTTGNVASMQARLIQLTASSVSNVGSKIIQMGTGDTKITTTGIIDNTGGEFATNGNAFNLQAHTLNNSQGKITHAGNGILNITANANITNHGGSIQTNGTTQLQSITVDNTQGMIWSKQGLASNSTTLNNAQGVISTNGEAAINVKNLFSNQNGTVEAGEKLSLTGQSIANQGGRIISLDASGLTVHAEQRIDNTAGIIGGNGDLNLIAKVLTNQSGQLLAQGNIIANVADNIDNTQGTIITQQNATLGQGATNISNASQGYINAGNNLAIQANNFDITGGSMAANHDISLQALTIKGGGKAIAGQDMNIAADSFIHGTGGDFKANRNMKITANTFSNKGSLTAVRDLKLSANSITNDAGSTFASGADLTITSAGDLTNSGKIQGSTASINTRTLTNNGSVMADQLTITADTISNTGNTASIVTNQTADLKAITALNNSATIYNLGSSGARSTRLNITTASLNNNGVIASGQNTNIAAQNVSSSGVLGAGINSNGSLNAVGDLTIGATGIVRAKGSNLSAGAFSVNAGTIDLSGARTFAGQNISLKATSGDINNTGASMQTNGILTIYANKAFQNDKDATGNIANIQAGQIDITADSVSNIDSKMIQSGTEDTDIITTTNIDNTGGTIATNGKTLNLTASTITNSKGNLVHAGNGTLNIAATTALTNDAAGTIQSNGSVNLQAGTFDNTQGNVMALKEIGINGNILTNDRGSIAAGGAATLDLQNGVSNQNGVIEAGNSLTLKAQAFTNNNGSITSLDNSGMTLNIVQNIHNTAGMIGGNGNVNLTAQSLVNNNGKVLSQGSIQADVSQNVNNTSGTIAAQQDVTIGKSSTTITNIIQGSITSGANLSVQANTLSNIGGTMVANKDVALTTNTINGKGSITAGQDLNITTNNDFIYSIEDNLKANRDLNLTAATVTNSGSLAAVRDLKITANTVTNNTNATLQGGSGLTIDATGTLSNTGTMEGNTANISAKSITNTGSVFGDAITMTANTISNNGNTAVIAATKNVNLYAKASLENKDDAMIYSMGDINIAGSKTQDVNKEYLDKTGSVLNESATIEADGDISIYTNTLTNKMREYEIKESVVSETRYGQNSIYQATDGRNFYLVRFYNPQYPKYSPNGVRILSQSGPKIGLVAETIKETIVVAKSPIGKIISGGNLKLRVGSTNNDMGWVIANGTMDAVGTLNNTAIGNVRSTTRRLFRETDSIWTRKANTDADRMYHGYQYYDYFDEEVYGIHGSVGKMYYETTTEQITSGASSIFGGGQQVIIQGGSVNNTTIAASSVPVTTVNNITSSGVNQGTASVKTNGKTNSTSAIQAVSGYAAVTSTSVPIGNMQTLLPKAQNQSVTSAQSDSNTNSQTTPIPTSTAINITSSTQNQSVTSAQSNSNTNSQTTPMPTGTTTNITSSTQNQSVTSAQTNNNASSQSTTVQTGSTVQTTLPSEQIQEVSAIQQTLNNTITLSTNGMFTTHQEPNSKYLVETNPRFANYGNFISSDYVLDQLGIDPAKTMKRLGDGFYEQRLVREQVTELTGRYYLNQYSSAEEQYKALMNNGVTYAKQFNLQVGVALTNEQMAQLTSDMVWMVEKEVDGQKVLVPEVYLSTSGNIDLKPNGAVISADKVTIKDSDSVNNAGVIKATEGVNIQAVNIANYGGTIDGGKSTTLDAQQDLVNFGGVITGEKVDLTAGNDLKNETISFTSTLPFMTKTTVGNVASINAGDSLTIAAHDIAITGGKVNAKQDVTINATGNFTVDSIKEQERLTVGKNLEDTVTNVVSSINAGKNVSITSTGDTTLKGAKITAGNALDLTAGGNIDIAAVKDETINDKTVGSSSNWKRTRTDNETVIGTTIEGGGPVTIKAEKPSNGTGVTDSENRGNITISGSTVNSKNDKVTISADKNVTIQEVTEKHESLVVTHKKKSGFLSSKTTDTMNHALINEVVGSTISGDTVAVISGNDLTVKGSNVVGTNDVTFTAQNDVTITSAAETGADEHYSYTKKSGLFSGGGLGFTIGSQSTKTTTKEQTLGEVGGTIGSIDGNVSITAGKKVDSEGTTFVSGKDLSITGKEVTIDNTVDTYDSQTKYEFKQSGLSVSLGGGIVNTATSAYNNIERSGEVEDERLKALYDYKAIKDLDKINDQLSKGVSKENLKKGVSVSVSIGSSKMTSEETVHTETVNTSNMNAGGDVTIKATEGDVNLKGTNINAENVTLDAAKNVNIGAAENKQQTTTNTSSSSWSVGGTIGSGFFGNVSKGSGKENENATTNTGSVIDANDTLKIKSGADTNIIGSQVKGDTVVANVDGNLNIVSKQDTDDYTSKNQSSGFGISTGPKGGVTGSISKGKTESTYASVTEQAGIHAGEGGFDINVGKNTDLKGAVIASDATPDKNKISTGTLTYSDIQNHAEYSASSVGVNLDTRKGTEKKDAGLTPNIGVKVSGDADSTTKSAISPGTIEVRSNPDQDLSGLSRDTDKALNALDKIFDKKTVAEQQELAKVFGEVAYKIIGDVAQKHQEKAYIANSLADSYEKQAQEYRDAGELEKAAESEKLATQYKEIGQKSSSWNEGGANITALHALVGGLMAEMGGGSFTSGAVGAGATEASRNLLKNLEPDIQQWGSAIIGAAASETVGGNAQTGASTAVSGTANNDLAHGIAGVGKAIYDGICDDAKGLVETFSNPLDAIGAMKDAAVAIYNLGKQQGFGAVFAELGTALSGDSVNKYNAIQNAFASGEIDADTRDYRLGKLAGELTYLIATNVPAPEKLAINPGIISKLEKISILKKTSTVLKEEKEIGSLPEVIVTADKIKKVEITGEARKYWTQATEYNGVKVYQRNDLINPNLVDGRGRTNLQRMEQGLAAIGPDGNPINLHHMTQTNDSAIAEVTQSFHQENTKVIHINPNTIPSGIDRSEFSKWRSDYWKNRANDFK